MPQRKNPTDQSRDGKPKQRRLHPEARKSELLDHAAQLLVTEGSEAFSVNGFAKFAGVNKTLVYYYFESKDDLLITLLRREYDAVSNETSLALFGTTTFEERLRNLLEVWQRLGTAHVVIGVLENTRTESGELERLVRESRLGAMRLAGALLENDFGLKREPALVAAGIVTSSWHGFAAALREANLDEQQAIELFVRMTLAAVHAAEV